MNCKVCGYALWDLPARTCPECNAPFKPSDFLFVPHSVQFRCPHCSQDYYGTGVRGGLEPAEFDCVGCGARVHEDEMVLLPTRGVHAEKTIADRVPWHERDAIGFRTALRSTFYKSLFRPAALARAMGDTTRLADAWRYAIVLSLLTGLLAGVVFATGFAILLSGFTVRGKNTGQAIAICAGFVAGVPAVSSVLVLAWGLATHALLAWIAKPKHGLSRTYECLCYAVSPVALAVASLCYFLWPVILLWMGIIAASMVHVRQGVLPWKAWAAVFAPPAALVLAFALWLAVRLWGKW